MSGGRAHKIRKIKITGGEARAKECNVIASSLSFTDQSVFALIKGLKNFVLYSLLSENKVKDDVSSTTRGLLSVCAPADNTM